MEDTTPHLGDIPATVRRPPPSGTFDALLLAAGASTRKVSPGFPQPEGLTHALTLVYLVVNV